MTITAYAFPVLYDVSFVGFARPPQVDRHGIFVIEIADADVGGIQCFLLNRSRDLRGCDPHVLNPVDYNANSWRMYVQVTSRAGIEYTEGSIRVRVKPLPLNSPIGKVIRQEYNDIPLETKKDFPL